MIQWAGVPRTYPLNKDGLPFADPNQISRYLNHARDHIAAVDWTDLDHGGFAVEAATVYASINMSHPYREGNGRAAKVFMSQLAADADYRLDYGRVTPQQWVNAAMLTHPDRGAFEPSPTPWSRCSRRSPNPSHPNNPPRPSARPTRNARHASPAAAPPGRPRQPVLLRRPTAHGFGAGTVADSV